MLRNPDQVFFILTRFPELPLFQGILARLTIFFRTGLYFAL